MRMHLHKIETAPPRAVTSPDRHSHVKLAEPPDDLPEISPEESFLIFPEYSDEAIASLFTVRYVEELRYVAAFGKWLVNDGQRWKYDDKLTADSRAASAAS